MTGPNSNLQLADHAQTALYELTLPPDAGTKFDRKDLFVHAPGNRRSRALNDATERFVDETRMGTDTNRHGG